MFPASSRQSLTAKVTAKPTIISMIRRISANKDHDQHQRRRAARAVKEAENCGRESPKRPAWRVSSLRLILIMACHFTQITYLRVRWSVEIWSRQECSFILTLRESPCIYPERGYSDWLSQGILVNRNFLQWLGITQSENKRGSEKELLKYYYKLQEYSDLHKRSLLKH